MTRLIASLFLAVVLILSITTDNSFGMKANIKYSIQVYTSKQKKYATQFLQKLKSTSEKGSEFFLYKTSNNYWTVRIYLLSSVKEAAQKLEEVKKITAISEASIVATDTTKLAGKALTPLLKEKVKNSGKTEYFYSFQIKSSRNLEDIVRFKEKLPANIKIKSFIYHTEKGYWTLRIYIVKGYRNALNLLSKVKKETGLKEISIVRSDIRKIKQFKIHYSVDKSTEKRENPFKRDIKRDKTKNKNINKLQYKHPNYSVNKTLSYSRKRKENLNQNEDMSCKDKSNYGDTRSACQQNITKLASKKVNTPITLDLRSYIARVTKKNIDLAIAFKDYKRSIVNFYKNLNIYRWNLSLNAGVQESFDREKLSRIETLSLKFNKVIYNGGIYPLLRKELEIISFLEREKILNSKQIVKLTAISNYATKLFHQELESLITEQLLLRREFLSSLKEMYSKGIKVSKYALLTEEREILILKTTLFKEKAAHEKADIEFRTLAELHTSRPIKVLPFRVTYTFNRHELEKKALIKNHILNIDRYNIRRSIVNYKIKSQENKPIVELKGSFDMLPKPKYTVGISLSYPLFENREKERTLLIEKLNILKSQLLLKKHAKEVTKKILSLYEDYKFFNQQEEVLRKILKIDQERLNISKRKYSQGIGDYISVRDSWNDLIETKKQLLLTEIMKNKILLDIFLITGGDIK